MQRRTIGVSNASTIPARLLAVVLCTAVASGAVQMLQRPGRAVAGPLPNTATPTDTSTPTDIPDTSTPTDTPTPTNVPNTNTPTDTPTPTNVTQHQYADGHADPDQRPQHQYAERTGDTRRRRTPDHDPQQHGDHHADRRNRQRALLGRNRQQPQRIDRLRRPELPRRRGLRGRAGSVAGVPGCWASRPCTLIGLLKLRQRLR